MEGPVSNSELHATGFLAGSNADYVERMLQNYTINPESVDETWQRYFAALDDAVARGRNGQTGPSWLRHDWPDRGRSDLTAAFDGQAPEDVAQQVAEIGPRIRKAAASGGVTMAPDQISQAVVDSIRALMLIRAYRIRGHRMATLDPLGLHHHKTHSELNPENYGFTAADMDRPIYLDHVLGKQFATMRQIIDQVRKTYCGDLALQYMHISNPEEASWLKERIEGYDTEVLFTAEGRRAILNKLVQAEGFEKFLQVKYTGTKRFGIDGGESLIPAMEQIIKRGGALGVRDIVIGMPHRGRLNVLTNVMGKPLQAIFNEFQGGSSNPEEIEGSGDVKYHLGASADREFDGNSVHLSLTANPSHLEAVNPVVLGKARAKQDQHNDVERRKVLPLLLHGDAAFAGQGVVAECFSMSGLVGHSTGGTIHLVVNNQIGFTTAPHHSRSSPYPTDIGLMTEAPIFHVNGDNPEAVVHAAKVATEFRQKFHKDVIVDMFCYRRFGHNEGDDPTFSQPIMYNHIKSHPTTLEIYAKRLVDDGLVPADDIEECKSAYRSKLENAFEAAANYKPNAADWLDGSWAGLKTAGSDYDRGKTGVTATSIRKVGKALCSYPDDFAIHRTLKRQLGNRQQVFKTGEGCDWAMGEALAFGTLLLEGFPVRLAGQDSTRGTFSQRHSAFVDQRTEDKYIPLNHIDPKQARFQVIDSMLSEFAVLGFEYGYSLSEPNALVLWEAQFGDFANGAQIMFDQFIGPGERKWLRMSGLVVLLPHGHEGQGPEHSSARPERILQLSAEENWIVANCTTPANYFHILRRQLHRSFRKPLIIMTPKSLLRHKMAISKLSEMQRGTTFHRLLWDDAEQGNSDTELAPDKAMARVVICTGKVYYDLLAERDRRGIQEIYLLRVEQLYPFPARSMLAELKRFPNADVVWCQEEPKNQGAWSFIEPNIEWALGQARTRVSRALYIGRPAAAAPAGGLLKQHNREQAMIVDQALDITRKGT